MTRRASFVDIPRIKVLIREMHQASKYRDRVGISEKALDGLLMSAVAGQGQGGPQGSFVHVAEQKGAVVGFLIGTLARVYHIGDKLVAQDLFLHVCKGSRADHLLALVDAYVAWARANRKVVEINLSWVDTLPGAARVARVYLRKGFDRTGEIFTMRLDGEGGPQ